MVKVVFADPSPKKSDTVRGQRATSVVVKRLRNTKGSLVQLRTVDAGSATLSEDITEVFAKNVAKARRENKKLFGSAEYAPKP